MAFDGNGELRLPLTEGRLGPKKGGGRAGLGVPKGRMTLAHGDAMTKADIAAGVDADIDNPPLSDIELLAYLTVIEREPETVRRALEN